MSAKQPTAADVEIGKRIRAYRNALRMSQTTLAEAVGVTFQQVQKYEKGVNRVSIVRLTQIAAALGVTLVEIAGEQPSAVADASSKEARQAAIAIDALTIPADREAVLSTVKHLCRRLQAAAQPAVAVILVAPLVLAMAKTPDPQAVARADLAARLRSHAESGLPLPDAAPEGYPYATTEQLQTLSTKHQHRLPQGWRFDDEPAIQR